MFNLGSCVCVISFVCEAIQRGLSSRRIIFLSAVVLCCACVLAEHGVVDYFYKAK